MFTLRSILRLAVGILGTFFLVLGLQWFVIPADIASQFSIDLHGPQGMSTGRADLGGLFVGLSVLTFLGLRGDEHGPAMLSSVAIILGAIAVGRVYGFLMDGITALTALLFVLEIVFVGLYSWLAKVLSNTPIDSD